MKFGLKAFFFLIATIYLVGIASAGTYIEPDENAPDLVKVFSSVSNITNVRVGHATDGSNGYLIYSVGAHPAQIILTVPKAKYKVDGSTITVLHTDDNGIQTLQLIPVTQKIGEFDITINLSSTCIGCFTGTAAKTETGKTNGSWLNYTNLLNASYATLNFTNVQPGTYSIGGETFTDRSAVQINNTGNATVLTYYQIFKNVTFDSEMQADFDDIRFWNVTSNQNQPYWIESKVDGSYANVWINVSSIPASSWLNDTIYMYYGNAGAASASNGTNTFIFFDDFEDGTLSDIWTWSAGNGGARTESGGILTLSSSNDDMWACNWSSLKMVVHVSGDFIAEATILNDNFTANPQQTGLLVLLDSNYANWVRIVRAYVTAEGNDIISRADNVNNVASATSIAYNYYPIYLRLTRSGSDIKTYYSNGGAYSEQVHGSQNFTSSAIVEVGLMSFDGGASQFTTNIDNFKVRKYVATEPTVTTGAEESASSNIYVIPQGHPTSENKTVTGSGIINLTLNPGVPLQNIQIFCSNGCDVTATAYFTQNSSTEFEGSSNGYYHYNTTLALNENISNGSINLTISDSTFLNSQFKGSPTFSTNNSNATLIYNHPYLNISLGETNISTFIYNVTIPYNNASTSTVSNQSFTTAINATITSTASDVDGNTVYCYGTLDGVTLTSCTSNDFGLKTVGTYVYNFNITDRNGTVGGTYPWVNKTATITVDYPIIIPPTPTLVSVEYGNFWINTSWQAGAGNVTDSFNSTNGTTWINSSLPYRNTTLSPHAWQNLTVYAWNNSKGNLSLTPLTNDYQIPNNLITVDNISSSYSIYAGQSLNIYPTSTDDDLDTPTFSSNATKGIFYTNNGTLLFNSVIADVGIYYWNITGDDGYGSTSSVNFTVTVLDDTPVAPTITGNITGIFFIRWDYTAGANTDTIEVYINNSLVQNSSVLFYNGTYSAHATRIISLRGYNSTGAVYSTWTNETTTIPNNAPTISGISDSYNINAGNTLAIDADATDVDSDSYSFNRNFTQGTFNTGTGVLSWVTTVGDIGTYSFYINVTDSYGEVATKTFTVTVSESGGSGTDWDWAQGYVKYSNGTVISGVLVTTTEGTDTTDANGYFSFGYVFIHGNSYNFNGTKTGFDYNNTAYTFSSGDSTWTNLTMNVTSGESPVSSRFVSGYVLDGSGTPLSASVVYGSNSTTSNGAGYYIFNNVANGTYNFIASKTHYLTNITSIEMAGANISNANLTLIQNQTYSISGYVKKDSDGTGILGAVVSYDEQSSSSEADGYYLIETLYNGTHSLSATKSGYNSEATSKTINGANLTNQNFSLTAASTGNNAEIVAAINAMAYNQTSYVSAPGFNGIGIILILGIAYIVRRRKDNE